MQESRRPLFHADGRSLLHRIVRMTAMLALLLVLMVAAVLIAFRIAAAQREQLAEGQGAPPNGRFVQAADVKLFVLDQGPKDGMPVLFIPGTGAWSETWRDALDACAARGYRCIALDLPPFGYSSRPADRDYSTPRQAARIAGLLDALGIRAAVLVGHSFGSRATMQLALDSPRRVRALVLVDAALTLEAPQHVEAEIPLPLRWTALRNGLIASTATNPLLTHYFLAQFTTRHEVLTPARVALYSQAFVRKGTTEAFGDWAMQFGEPTAQLLCATPAAYRTLSIPALVLWGERDAVTPLSQGRSLAALLPQSRLEVLPGVGHIPQIESPAAFNERLMAFLGSL